jgi:hypothetical protein
MCRHLEPPSFSFLRIQIFFYVCIDGRKSKIPRILNTGGAFPSEIFTAFRISDQDLTLKLECCAQIHHTVDRIQSYVSLSLSVDSYCASCL